MNAADFLRDTIDLIKQIETRFLELGARLYNIREKKLWHEAGYETYEDFLDTAKITYGNASILASVHKHFVVDAQMPYQTLTGIGYSNLYEAIPLLEKETPEKVVEIARTLTRAEIKQEVREQTHPDCIHPDTVVICAKCHKRV